MPMVIDTCIHLHPVSYANENVTDTHSKVICRPLNLRST
jgi:hypothetical protein